MNIHSLSLNVMNVYTKLAQPAAVGVAPAPVSKETKTAPHADGERGAGHHHPLVRALSVALRDIGIVSARNTPAVPATGTTVATDATATPAATPAAGGEWDVVVQQFAHALVGALGASREARGRSGEHRQDGEHRHRWNHHGNGPQGVGYGDLAQRLESLSRSMVQTPPASGASPAPPASSAPATPPVVDAPSTPPTTGGLLPQAPPSPAVAIDGAVSPLPAAPATQAPRVAATSTLLDAFSKLFSALQPLAATPAPAVDRTSQLQQFLQKLAQELSRSRWDTAAVPQPGVFVDHCA